jgi:hypothetical protein
MRGFSPPGKMGQLFLSVINIQDCIHILGPEAFILAEEQTIPSRADLNTATGYFSRGLMLLMLIR